jgi:hypothetical protein
MSLVCASFTTFSFSFRFFWHGSFSLFFASYGCHELLEKGHHIGRRLLKSPVPVVLLCTSPPPPHLRWMQLVVALVAILPAPFHVPAAAVATLACQHFYSEVERDVARGHHIQH